MSKAPMSKSCPGATLAAYFKRLLCCDVSFALRDITPLPKLTDEALRVTVFQFRRDYPENVDVADIVRAILLLSDARMRDECPIAGDVFVWDVSYKDQALPNTNNTHFNLNLNLTTMVHWSGSRSHSCVTAATATNKSTRYLRVDIITGMFHSLTLPEIPSF